MTSAPPRTISTAFVMGAGLGTRLRPLTDACPKPLLPVHGQPMITRVFDSLLAAGIRRLIVNTHYLSPAFATAFPDSRYRGVPIHFRHEEILLGTGGGLRNISDLLAPGEPLLLHSGDVVTNLPLDKLIETHFARQGEVTLALRTRKELRTVGIDTDGRIRKVGRATPEDPWEFHDYANAAILEPVFLDRLPDASPREIGSVWARMAEEKGSIFGTVLNSGYWYNVGTPEEYDLIHSQPWPPVS